MSAVPPDFIREIGAKLFIRRFCGGHIPPQTDGIYFRSRGLFIVVDYCQSIILVFRSFVKKSSTDFLMFPPCNLSGSRSVRPCVNHLSISVKIL